MSKSGTRDTNSVPKQSVNSFLRLIEIMSERLGSREKACKEIGINSGHVAMVKAGKQNLSVTVAAKILAAHKRLKSTEEM